MVGAAASRTFSAPLDQLPLQPDSLVSAQLLNHNNPGPIIGNITSPLFGVANQNGRRLRGGGFSEDANNRRLELQMRFTF
jgi:hypothetical protein